MRHALALCLFAFVQAAAAQTSIDGARNVALSPANTRIAFSIGALGLFAMEGSFTRFAGELRFDAARPEATQVAVLVDTTGIEAAGGGSDTARELDLLRTREFPTLAFRSQSVSIQADGHAVVAGHLTLAGVTRPLDLLVRRDMQRLVASGVLERSAHGLTALRPLLSDRVSLSITVRLPG